MDSERQVFLKYLIDKKLLKEYAAGLDRSVRLIKEYLNRDADLKNKDWFSILYLLGLEPKDLGINKKLPQSTDLIKRGSLERPVLTYKNWIQDHQENSYGYSSDYYKKILLEFESLENELLIYRYFTNLEVDAIESGYFKGYDSYYNGLEKIINDRGKKNKDFNYIRIMAPPIGVYKPLIKLSKVKYIEALVKLLFPPTLNHCLRMLDEASNNNVSFYLLTQPRRLCNIAIINKSHKLLREMYRIESDGYAIPDEVNVYHRGSSLGHEEYIKSHHTDLYKIIMEHAPKYCIKLTLEDLQKAVEKKK